MKCLVTGGAGFIGSHLVDELVEDGHEVVVIDNLSTGKKENINPKAKFYNIDICEMHIKGLCSMFEGVDVVFHTAAKARVQPSIQNPTEFNDVNVGGTLNMLQACVDYGVNRFVFSSSSSVYGETEDLPTSELSKTNPMSPYALQKLIGEQYCKLYTEIHDLETVCLRYFNVYGDRMSMDGAYKLVIPIFIEQKLNGKPMTIRGDGEQRRDFTHIDDIVDALYQCIGKDFRAEFFELGRGVNYSINELAALWGGYPTEYIDARPGEYPWTLCEDKNAREKLGWVPFRNLDDYIKTQL